MKAKRMFGTVEVVFDISYLVIASGFAVFYLSRAGQAEYFLFGLMAMVLVFGDVFHLVPRILSIVKQDEETYGAALGLGKMITSIGMTVFYLFLWQIGVRASGYQNMGTWTAILYGLAAIRIVLCLLPRNRWRTEGCSVQWNLIRNIPFLVMGLIVAVWFFLIRNESGFPYLWISIILSFGFYLPVVLYAKRIPKIGMLMLPKTCMYIWIISMGMFGRG